MPLIRIFRQKPDWSVSPATVLPGALLSRLFGLRWNLTVVLDGNPMGTIGVDQVKVFEVEPGEHRLYMRFLLLRRSKQLRVPLKESEERQFLCATNGIGWPTLWEESSRDAAGIPGTSTSG